MILMNKDYTILAVHWWHTFVFSHNSTANQNPNTAKCLEYLYKH
jgi:hypothetical protein